MTAFYHKSVCRIFGCWELKWFCFSNWKPMLDVCFQSLKWHHQCLSLWAPLGLIRTVFHLSMMLNVMNLISRSTSAVWRHLSRASVLFLMSYNVSYLSRTCWQVRFELSLCCKSCFFISYRILFTLPRFLYTFQVILNLGLLHTLSELCLGFPVPLSIWMLNCFVSLQWFRHGQSRSLLTQCSSGLLL